MLKYPFGLVMDFDLTVANTFEPSPTGIGVKEAYEHAVESVLGRVAVESYRESGGLRNRAPREVVEELQRKGFKKQRDTGQMADELVKAKIECLINEIGKPLPDGSLWPRLTNGFDDFWKRLTSMDMDEVPFTGVLSSGHYDFIFETFRVHGLEMPGITVTDDELRVLPEPLCKPDGRLWTYMLSVANVSLAQAVYIGDDPVKDGTLARNAGIPFLHFAAKGTSCHGAPNTFDDWRNVLPHLGVT